MELSIHTNGMTLSQRLQEYVEKKMDKLSRYLPSLQMVNVELSQRKSKGSNQSRVAQLTIRDAKGTILRAEEKNETIYGAIDSVVNKMYRQIKRYRGRMKKQRRNGEVGDLVADAIPAEIVLEPEIAEEETPSIVKRKQFSIQLMSEEEAIDQMLLLDHDFFVFTNLEGETNVLYKRKSGDLGILQPTV